MKLSKLHIQNFKSFENITINFNQDINIFTGVNNAGKSTVLEAMALWSECFNLLIKQSLRVQPKLSIAKGDYKLGDQTNLFPYNQIISVRSPNFEDIFYNLDTSKTVIINSTVVNDEKNNIDIGFSITRGNGGNYQIVLVNYSEFNYKKFNDFFNNFPNPINIIYASPINSLLPYEEFQTLPKISNKVKCRESLSVLRNRLYQLKKSAQLFPQFLKDLSYILTDGLEEIAFTMLGDEHKDVSLDINIRIGGKDIFKSLSLLGSGTLQMIEILLSLYEDSKELQIVLLDEPDSHIHRDIQKRLLYILTYHTKGTQIFLTTHNESLIRSSKPDHLFYLEKNIKTKIYNPIVSNELTTKKVGLQSSHHIKILKELGSETGLDIINALEADRLFLVEGSTDARAIEIILSQKFIDHKYNIM
ncbi:MAG: ATP-dependent nuclease, partial [Clostridium sp.]